MSTKVIMFDDTTRKLIFFVDGVREEGFLKAIKSVCAALKEEKEMGNPEIGVTFKRVRLKKIEEEVPELSDDIADWFWKVMIMSNKAEELAIDENWEELYEEIKRTKVIE